MNQKNNLVSIIVPCYNQAQYLDECLQSLIEQTYTNWECIIVNDGSPDNTEEIAINWTKKDNKFKYLYKENGGLSSARNAGIKSANGKYILPLDADDKIAKNYIEICLNEFIKDENLTIAYGKGVKFGMVNEIWNLTNYNFESLLHGNMIFCTAMFKKEKWNDVGGYDENMKLGFEDWEFWINCLKSGGNVIQNKNAIFYYRIKENSMTIDLLEDSNKKYELRKYIFNKHKNLYTDKDLYDLFNENNEIKKKINNLHQYFSLNILLISIYEKIKYNLKTLFYN
jgi:glycosyltransferase involved in cell wall biosynthesis